MRKKYSSIIDVGLERDKIKKDIEDLIAKRDRINQESLKNKESLTTEYNNARLIYEKLQKEISLLEESLEMMEVGVYKPHFDFGSSC